MKSVVLAWAAMSCLAGCSADMDPLGSGTSLSPVGSGLEGASTSATIAQNPAFAGGSDSWMGGSGDLFRDARARKPGDLITVKIAIDDKASLNNTSNRSRKAAAESDLGFTYGLMGVVGADVSGKGDFNSNSNASLP